jgi:PKD repeat protein
MKRGAHTARRRAPHRAPRIDERSNHVADARSTRLDYFRAFRKTMMRARHYSHTSKIAFLVVLTGAMMAMAGCTGFGGAKKSMDNKPPEAVLKSEKTTGWTGESWIFDGRESKDPDGQITTWRFDFGDGTKVEAKRQEDARMNHSYLKGGEYAVVLTVFDDGAQQAGSLSSNAQKAIAVNEKVRVADAVFSAAIGQTNAKSNGSFPFQVYNKADRFEATIDVTNGLATGSSEVNLKITDPHNKTLDEQKATVGNGVGAKSSISLSGTLKDQGTHHLEVKAVSGTVTINGEIRIYYDAGYIK